MVRLLTVLPALIAPSPSSSTQTHGAHVPLFHWTCFLQSHPSSQLQSGRAQLRRAALPRQDETLGGWHKPGTWEKRLGRAW